MPEDVLRTSEVSVVVSGAVFCSVVHRIQLHRILTSSLPFLPSLCQNETKNPPVPLSKHKENTWVNKVKEVSLLQNFSDPLIH